jgi:hypothetical protein
VTPRGLARLLSAFEDYARVRVPAAQWEAYLRYRDQGAAGMSPEEVSDALIAVAPRVSAFLARLFGVEAGREGIAAAIATEGDVLAFKREFVKKRTVRRKRAEIDALSPEAHAALDADARAVLSAATSLPDHWNDELAVAQAVLPLVRAEDLFRKALARGGVESTPDDLARAHHLAAALRARLATALPAEVTDDTTAAQVYAAALEVIDRWCLLRMVDKGYDHHWVSLRLPKTLDHQNLVPLRRPRAELPEAIVGAHHLRDRDGFALTDARMGLREVMSEVEYCIYCHDRNKDSCSKGLRNKDGSLKPNPLGIALTGCPLDEKISEAHYLKGQGDALAALAVVMVDNPMCPGTGHRICNDCMKACIYQKQEPVNIPQIETSILTDVLNLRWGFELYDLLTRWNPLRQVRPVARAYNGRNVLVVGLGPAGYTLAQHLAATRASASSASTDSRSSPCPSTSSKAPSSASTSSWWTSTAACSSGSAASASTGSPCAGTRTSSPWSTSPSRGGRTSRSTAACASAAPSTSTTRGAWAFTTSPSPRARASPPSSTSPTGSSAGSVRRPTSSWPCSSPGPTSAAPSPTSRCGSRRWSSAAGSPASTPPPSSARTTSCRSRRCSSATRPSRSELGDEAVRRGLLRGGV